MTPGGIARRDKGDERKVDRVESLLPPQNSSNAADELSLIVTDSQLASDTLNKAVPLVFS